MKNLHRYQNVAITLLREKWRKFDIRGHWHNFLGTDTFTKSSRPVIRWIKGDGLDDEVTSIALAQATRIYGQHVDYCLLTQGISPDRARKVLSYSDSPVEWRVVSKADNPALSHFLQEANCDEENFGYWWKWFPERIRPNAPEWILEGDMVITDRPPWFEAWAEGSDVARMSTTNEVPGVDHIFGEYEHLVNPNSTFYSGIVSLPPGDRYQDEITKILNHQPLKIPHNGKRDMSEQGVVVAALQNLNPTPIPLNEFPFARAFQESLDFGGQEPAKHVWGYHFGNAFVMHNPHIEKLQGEGTIDKLGVRDIIESARWLNGGHGQWGFKGWGMIENAARAIVNELGDIHERKVVEFGTSRGYLSFILAQAGAHVITVDREDRGARQNLAGLKVEIYIMSVLKFLRTNKSIFEIVCVDLHGNSRRQWRKLWRKLSSRIQVGGQVVISNAELRLVPGWAHEDGVPWLHQKLSRDPNWMCTLISDVVPGILIVKRLK
jgi:predicted O-methyltransferase YrrM